MAITAGVARRVLGAKTVRVRQHWQRKGPRGTVSFVRESTRHLVEDPLGLRTMGRGVIPGAAGKKARADTGRGPAYVGRLLKGATRKKAYADFTATIDPRGTGQAFRKKGSEVVSISKRPKNLDNVKKGDRIVYNERGQILRIEHRKARGARGRKRGV